MGVAGVLGACFGALLSLLLLFPIPVLTISTSLSLLLFLSLSSQNNNGRFYIYFANKCRSLNFKYPLQIIKCKYYVSNEHKEILFIPS